MVDFKRVSDTVNQIRCTCKTINTVRQEYAINFKVLWTSTSCSYPWFTNHKYFEVPNVKFGLCFPQQEN